MTAAPRTSGSGGLVRNALFHYYPEIRAAARHVAAGRAAQPAIPLEPGEPGPAFAAFSDVTDLALTEVEAGLRILDLTRNPGTATTKTMPSLLMIARAAEHIRRTGERVLLLTPTSGNKGTALRDAVARALANGLASPQDLRIVTLVPTASQSKLRHSPLSEDAALREANPVALADVEQPADVKSLSNEVVEVYADRVLAETGFRIWYTLDLDNYRIADAARAYAEADLYPITADSAPRVHVHAVSSAFGLLGYHLGHKMLAAGLPGHAVPARHPAFLIVQQLATPDMVTSLLGVKVPDYEQGPDEVWRQRSLAEFPAETDDPDEVIDPTFYTRAPATRPQLNAIVGRHGGGGIVVSRRECLQRYDRVRALATGAGIDIGADPTALREWSLVKALTGALVARERGLLDPAADVVVHASGCYRDEILPPLREEHTIRTDTAGALADAVLRATRA
ncbi:MAG TPA: DUF6002 family protein [Kribbellaceae bacterium]|nr:DUF6002 family protein [Kribbellaceae bacterium]